MLKNPAFCLIFFFALFGNNEITAQNWNPNSTPTRAYKSSQAVFSAQIVRAASVKQLSANAKAKHSFSDDSGNIIPTVKVRTMYKRADAYAVGEGDELTIYPKDGCQNVYAVGENWLFYAAYDEYNFVWTIGDCYRTKPTSAAADDLKFFGNLPDSPNKSRVSGVISRLISPATKTRKAVRQPLANVEISIVVTDYQKTPEERKTFIVKTDENGVYEMYDNR